MSRIYLFKAPKKTADGLQDFLYYLEAYLDAPEIYASDDTLASYILGDFIKEYAGVVCDYVPALVVMDEDGNATEYYCFTDPETIKHETITQPETAEDIRARRVLDLADPWELDGETVETVKKDITERPGSVIDYLLGIIDNLQP